MKLLLIVFIFLASLCILDGKFTDNYHCTTFSFSKCDSYNKTYLPNYLNETSVDMIKGSYESLLTLRKETCGKSFELFLCAFLFPVCSEGKKVGPCKSFCKTVLTECFSRDKEMLHYCDSLPENDLCIQDFYRNEQCPQSLQVPTNLEYKIRLSNETVVNNCGFPCNRNLFDGMVPGNFVRAWIGFWSGLCTLSTLFTVSTFLLDAKRFQYPERPIIYLSACYMVVSISYLIGISLNNKFNMAKRLNALQKWQVSQHLKSGKTLKEIAEMLNIGVGQVRTIRKKGFNSSPEEECHVFIAKILKDQNSKIRWATLHRRCKDFIQAKGLFLSREFMLKFLNLFPLYKQKIVFPQNHHTIAFKNEVIRFYETHGMNKTVHQFGLYKSTVTSFVKIAGEIEAAVDEGRGNRTKVAGLEQYGDIEDHCKSFYESKRRANRPVTGTQLLREARLYGYRIGILPTRGWLYRYQARKRLAIKKIYGTAASVSSMTVERWLSLNRRQLLSYNKEDVYNADETGIF